MIYKPCPISRSKIILSNPHLLVITRSRIKVIDHFSFCYKFSIYTCHDSVCIFLKRDCHLRKKDHHRDHQCNYIPALTSIEEWHTQPHSQGLSSSCPLEQARRDPGSGQSRVYRAKKLLRDKQVACSIFALFALSPSNRHYRWSGRHVLQQPYKSLYLRVGIVTSI